MGKIIIAATILGVIFVIAGDRRERRPGNIAPTQLISAAGAWALVFANASALAIAIRDGSLILGCSVVATLAIALFLFLRDEATGSSSRETPEAVKLVVDDLKQLFGGAPRLGMDSLEAVVVTGNCPGIGVAVRPQGRVIVRVRRDVVQWLERHQQPGRAGVAVISSFARFIVLHELGHVLNGDHRTFRFVRAVLLAHVVWIVGALVAAASFAGNHDATPVAVASSIVLLFAVQSLVARRFIAERERLADWRAVQTLAPADVERLLERGGRRRSVPNPTQLEKLMIDLKTQARPGARGGRLLSRLIALVWAEGDDIQRRVKDVAEERFGAAPKPVLWAALIGMQCGLLTMSVSVAVLCVAPPLNTWQLEAVEAIMLVFTTWVVMPVATFCQLRIDPSRVSVRKVKHGSSRVVVGVVFYLAFSGAALALHRFHVHFSIASMPPDLIFFGMLILAAMLVAMGAWIGATVGGGDGGGELHVVPRSDWVVAYPLLAGMALVLAPLSIAASYVLGLGSFRSWLWFPLAFVCFGVYIVSTMMARSSSPLLRATAPMASLDTPAPVLGFRVFWRNVYVDLSRTTLTRAALTTIAAQWLPLLFLVGPVGLLMQSLRTVLTAEMTYRAVLFGGFGVYSLVLVIPHRYGAYNSPSARLLDGDRLQLFERLLSGARIAHAKIAEGLETALAQWLRNEQFPNAVLPDVQAVWPLASLRSLVHIARETGETMVLARWRDRIERALREVVVNDAVPVAPGQPPSLHWTVLAAAIVDEADLHNAFAFDRMLDRIEQLLDERLSHGMNNLLTDVVAACRLLRAHGRTGPDPQRMRRVAHASSLVSQPSLRQSLAELCELADITGDAELRVKLGSVVRFRSWEALQLNPRKDVLLLLDCYLAAASLGETDSRQAAAGVLVAELAFRVSEELMEVVDGGTEVRK
jgi:hypothetical protein